MDRVNCVAVGRAEGQVQFPAIGTGGWTEPEAGDAIVPETDDESTAARRLAAGYDLRVSQAITVMLW